MQDIHAHIIQNMARIAVICGIVLSNTNIALAANPQKNIDPDADTSQDNVLAEVTVTAQKHEQSLQDTPIAISVLDSEQLEAQNINTVGDLGDGAIPSLRVYALGNTPQNLIVSIRGNAPTDINQVTRDPSVAFYLDGVYLGRSHGLGFELVDPERIEVLRGPQGTLFGRNSVGGAVSLISKKPSGELDIKQTLRGGRFNEFRSATHINLPEFIGIRAKIDYLHAERDGWVSNAAPGESDYAEYEKDGGRISLSWQVSDAFSADYAYDQSENETVQNYFQVYEDNLGLIGVERERRTQTRFPVSSVEPSVTEQKGHALTLEWRATEQITFKSISAYRELEEEVNTNYAGALYFNGLNNGSDMDQDQLSQEFQVLGSSERIDWVGGLYYFKEEIDKIQQNEFTLDVLGFITGTPLTPIDPPTTFNVFTGADSPPRIITAEAESKAIYAHASWTPALSEDRLTLSGGLRYTEDERSGDRFEVTLDPFDLDSENVDYSFVLDYRWTQDISTYVKWSTAYKSGGVSTLSASFVPFDTEDAETFELGIKSEFWDRRVRFNAAIFTTDYDGMQLDFLDPLIPTITETINAANTVQVDGVEVDLNIKPLPGLTLGASYTYLDGDMPLQPNPLADNALQQFYLPQAPQHAGSLTLDYRFSPWRFGALNAHIGITSTDQYSYVTFGQQRLDAYTLVNARLSLADITLGSDTGGLSVSLWGKNLTDEEYVIMASAVGDPPVTIIRAYGAPRTVGVDVTYQFN